jgi:hypothetical protein
MNNNPNKVIIPEIGRRPNQTRKERLAEADVLWFTDPIQAARLYNSGAREHGDYLIMARVGTQAGENGEGYFREADASAERHGASPEERAEINALREWFQANTLGLELPLPAVFVAEKLAQWHVDNSALEQNVIQFTQPEADVSEALAS